MNEQEEKQLQHLKYKLEDLKRRKIKKVEGWRLNKTERTYIESLGYELVPVIYEIKTKTFPNLYHIHHSLLKEIHYDSKAGKKRIGKPLKAEEKELLKAYDVKFRPVKFRVIVIP